MRKKIALCLVLVMLLTLFPQLTLFSLGSDYALAASVSLAKIDEVKGGVFVKKGGGNKEFKGIKGMSLIQGDTVRTDKEGSATLVFKTGSKMTVGPNTVFTVSKAAETKNSGGKISVKLKSGSVWNKVKSLVNVEDEYQIETPTAVMGVRGTLFLAAFDPSTGETTGSVMEGAVGVQQNSPGNEGQNERTVPMGSSIQISSPDQGEGQGQGEPPQPNPIDMNAIIENEDPSILAQIAQDTIERLQELQQQSQSYLAGFENTNSLDYLQAALQLAEVSAQLADLTNQFMSAVEGTEQEQQINEILQEYNTSLEDMRQQIEQLSNEIQELKETLVETAQEAGISPEEIERILQNAPTAGAGADSSTSLPPLPETPVTPPTSGGESSGDTGDREEEPGSGGEPGGEEPGGEEPGGEEPGGEEPGNDEYQGPKAASPGVVLAKYDDVSEEFEYDDILQFYFDKPVKVEPLLDIEKWNAALQNVYPDGSFGSGEDTISYSYFHEDEQGVEYAKDFSIRLTDGFNLPKNGLTFTLVSEGYLIEEDNEIIVMESGEIRADFTIPSILTNNIYWNYGASVTNLDYPFGEEFSDVGSYAIFNDDNLIPENFELIGVIGTLIPIDIYEEKHITLLGEPSASVNIWYYDKSFVRKDLSKDWLKAEIVSYGMTYGDPTYTWRVVLPKEITDAINTSLPNSSRDYFIALEIQGEIQDETQDGATWKSVPIEAVGAITKDNIAPSVKFDGFNGHQLWLDINEPIRHFQETSFEEFFDEFIEKSFIEGLTIRIGKGDNALTYSGEEVKTLIDNVDFYKEVSTQPRYDLTAAIYFSESAWNLFNNKEYIEDHFTPVVIAYKPDLVAEPITDMAGNEMSFSITLYYHEVWGMWTEYSNATIEVLDYNEETQEILLETEELLCTVNEDGIVIDRKSVV